MYGTAAYNRDRLQSEQGPVQGPEESPVVQDQKLRDWIRKQTLREERLEFNKDFPEVNERFQARHDSDFLLPDAYAQLRPVPTQPELHGMYSVPMIGSNVPGYVDPRLTNIGVVGNSDLVSSDLQRGTGSVGMVPRAPGLGDKLTNDKMLGALKKMLFKGTAEDKDLNVREWDRISGRPWRGR